ncbi:MAG: isoprenyl transferase [Armatimonadota bacterium]|nr:isoprenyl transferase [Armatimonadota bacterium]MCX7778212.1 isoprenyl transferase [Armatimonadota bacterium]MDW8025673.1 isoprenyl transferase [Armatimonadota bacterium]
MKLQSQISRMCAAEFITMCEGLTEEECLNLIDRSRLPRHIAIIMDGNRRWAKERNIAILNGHRAGARATRQVVEACVELGIPILTLYAFSTENWQRPAPEVKGLMHLIEMTLRREKYELHRNGIQIRHIGLRDRLPSSLLRELDDTVALTRDNKRMILNLAINYGGRQEILSAVRRLVKDAIEGKTKPDAIDEVTFQSYLFTNSLPDPDLLIRTAGEQRISNFLLWQLAYTEFFIAPIYWPDFTRKHLYIAILSYQARERRFGGVVPIDAKDTAK